MKMGGVIMMSPSEALMLVSRWFWNTMIPYLDVWVEAEEASD